MKLWFIDSVRTFCSVITKHCLVSLVRLRKSKTKSSTILFSDLIFNCSTMFILNFRTKISKFYPGIVLNQTDQLFCFFFVMCKTVKICRQTSSLHFNKFCLNLKEEKISSKFICEHAKAIRNFSNNLTFTAPKATQALNKEISLCSLRHHPVEIFRPSSVF